MRTVDLLAFCINALRRHGFRTFMMFIAMSIGVAAVITMIAVGQGAELGNPRPLRRKGQKAVEIAARTR